MINKKRVFSFILVFLLFIGTTVNVFAANAKFIEQIKNDYIKYESKTSKDYASYEKNTKARYEAYKKKESNSLNLFIAGTQEDLQKLNQLLSEDVKRLEKTHGSNAYLREYKNLVSSTYLSSPMQQYAQSTNPNYLNSFMMKYKNTVNESYLSSAMMKYKNAVNQHYLGSPMMKYKNAVNQHYLNSPMQKLKNGSNEHYLNSIMYQYKRGNISQSSASKQWNALRQSETGTIQKIISESKKSINQIESQSREAILQQKHETVNGILSQRTKSLKAISDARKQYFGEGINFEELVPNLGEINVIIDGEWLGFEQPPTIKNGSTLVPMRAIFEKLNAEVKWNQQTKTVTAGKGSTKIALTLNKKSATINGKAIALETPAQLINNHTIVPIRFVSESLGADVKWNQQKKTVFIASR